MNGVSQYGGGGSISDEAFGPSWNGDTKKGASRNALYDYLITIGAGFGNTAFVRTSGNDANAIVGNYLLPFATIGAAITALGSLTGSALFIDAGTYVMTDANAPYGLKAPGSKYDIYLAVGSRIEYYGTYGLFCMDGNDGTAGQIFGYGDLLNYSSSATKVVDGKSGYTFNVANVTVPVNFEYNRLLNEILSGSLGLVRIGNCPSSVAMNNKTRAYSRTGIVVYADTGSRFSMGGTGSYDSVGDFIAPTGVYTLRVENPSRFTLQPNTVLTARGDSFGNANTRCIVINNTANALIQFFNLDATCLQAPAGYKLIEFEAVPVGGIMNNLSFVRNVLRNRQNNTFSSSGFSFFSNVDCSFKVIDSYAEKNTGGTGIMNNLISTGNGLMIEPNII